MTLKEAISLINSGLIRPTGPVHWADLGCGEGLFTLALASLLPAGSVIYGVDKNNPLKKQTTVPYPLSFSSLTKLFTGAGYASVLKLNERPSVYGRAHMYAALVEKTTG